MNNSSALACAQRQRKCNHQNGRTAVSGLTDVPRMHCRAIYATHMRLFHALQGKQKVDQAEENLN